MEPYSNIRALSPILGSLILSLILIFCDMVVYGSFLVSAFVCPIWFIVALVRACIWPVTTRLALARILAPAITVILAVVNSNLQIAHAKASETRIIQACEQYHNDNETYPDKLSDLVPRYLNSVPTAKYCCLYGDFMYWGSPTSILTWTEVPPFGRRVYDFDRRQWRYVD
jgi:hypothetical protein